MPERMPLGDNTIHIGSNAFVANGGVVEYGGPAQGPVGIHSEGARSWALRGLPIPGSPSIGSLQVEPIVPEANYDGLFPRNGGETAWKGDLGDL